MEQVPNSNSCNEDKVSLDELKERFTVQEAKLDGIISMLSQQLCPCKYRQRYGTPDKTILREKKGVIEEGEKK